MSLYLASQSPRRRDILQQIGVAYHPLAVSVDEAALAQESAAEYVTRLALLKAQAGLLEAQSHAQASAQPAWPVLGADTCVVLDGQILGKPAGHDAALDTLRRLSGRTHQVFSGVALATEADSVVELSITEVSFRVLDDALIERYWLTGEPQDKAGSYGIQGKGAILVEKISGSYSGVVGLPIETLLPLLDRFGVPYWQDSLES